MKRDCAVAGLRIRGSVRVGREKGNSEGSKVALSTRSYFKWRPLPNKARRIFFFFKYSDTSDKSSRLKRVVIYPLSIK